MEIVAHRGHWTQPEQKNTQNAFEDALEFGFGIETDIRDSLGRLVISHDVPRGNEMTVDDFLALCKRYPNAGPIALNIKSDGLAKLLEQALAQTPLPNSFVFDMSVPDALSYLPTKIRTFTRLSEYESPAAYEDRAGGYWVDAFHSEWYRGEFLVELAAKGKPICIVSPELHRREHLAHWSELRRAGIHRLSKVSLCTDLTLQAKEYFA